MDSIDPVTLVNVGAPKPLAPRGFRLTLKYEAVYLNDHASVPVGRPRLDAWFPVYNRERPHSPPTLSTASATTPGSKASAAKPAGKIDTQKRPGSNSLSSATNLISSRSPTSPLIRSSSFLASSS